MAQLALAAGMQGTDPTGAGTVPSTPRAVWQELGTGSPGCMGREQNGMSLVLLCPDTKLSR